MHFSSFASISCFFVFGSHEVVFLVFSLTKMIADGVLIRGSAFFLAIFAYKLLGQLQVARGSTACRVVEQSGQTVTGSLAQAYVAWNYRVEHHVAKMALELV